MEIIMTDAHKEIMLRYRKQIVENISMEDIMSNLMSTKILLHNHVQEIRSQKGCRQTECFLDILPRRPDSSFQKFITVLNNTDQRHIANLLAPHCHETNLREIGRSDLAEAYPPAVTRPSADISTAGLPGSASGVGIQRNHSVSFARVHKPIVATSTAGLSNSSNSAARHVVLSTAVNGVPRMTVVDRQ